MPPQSLLISLARSGINLLFEESDSQFAEHTTKLSAMERKAYADIALVSSICTITNSKWNHNEANHATRAVFRVSKKLNDPSLSTGLKEEEIDLEFVKNSVQINFTNDEEWNLMTYEQDRCCFVDCTDSTESFNHEPQKDLQTHLNIYTALQHKGGEGEHIAEYVEASDMLLCETVRTLLLLTKPFSW